MRVNDRPVLVYPRGPSPSFTAVRNDGPDSVKYAATESGAASGTPLTSGSSVSLTSPTWFVAAVGAQVNVTVTEASSSILRVQSAVNSAFAISGSGTADVVVTWPTPFADANYVVVAFIEEALSAGTTGALMRQVRAKTASDVTIRVSTGSQAFSSGQITLHAIGVGA